MQATVETKAPVRAENRISAWLDAIFSQPYLYAVFAVILLRPRALLDVDALITSVLQVEAFPLFRVATYVLFTVVLICYILRWVLKDIKRVNKTLLCILGMFLYLAGITFVFNGASGYHIDWHAGFALMMMIDMGLQRERKSLIRGMTGAFEFWVYLNVISFIIFPQSLNPADITPGWILDNRVFYYRMVFPALGLALMRYYVLGKEWGWRTAVLIATCAITVAVQRGGTALIGVGLLLLLLLWCNRRALPRYITPFLFTLLAAAMFIGIQFFDLLRLFGTLITEALEKSMTLSSRTVIWNKTLEVVFNNPLTGVGYLPVLYMRELLGGPSFSHTHNQLLELMLHGGAIAVALYLAATHFASQEAIKYRRSPAVKAMTLLICTFAIMGVVEIFHNDPIYYALFVFLSRADCLTEGVKPLPRISVFKRVKRDIRKLVKKA